MPAFTKRIAARREEVLAALEELQGFLDGYDLPARLRNAVEVSAEERQRLLEKGFFNQF